MSESTTPPTKHQCGTCGLVFDSLEALREHERQHQSERAGGEPPLSDTRRSGSHAGSNVSPCKEGQPLAKEGPAPVEPGSELPGRAPAVPPAKK